MGSFVFLWSMGSFRRTQVHGLEGRNQSCMGSFHAFSHECFLAMRRAHNPDAKFKVELPYLCRNSGFFCSLSQIDERKDGLMSLLSKVSPAATLAASAFAFLITMTSLVAAQEQGPYARLYGGLASVQGMTFNDATSADLDLDGGTGLNFGGALGYRFGSGFRTEIDLSYSEASLNGTFQENVQTFVPCGEISNSPCLDGTVDGDYEGLSAIAMAYYDFATGSQITPYVGLGIGLINADLEATTPGALNDAATIEFALLDGSDTELAYRLAAGFAYDAGSFDIMLDYSWTRSGRLALAGQGAFTTFAFDRRVNAHAFTVGARFTF